MFAITATQKIKSKDSAAPGYLSPTTSFGRCHPAATDKDWPTLNNASGYSTNGLYGIPNSNHNLKPSQFVQ